jgi:two-component system NtrC family response regulator
MTCARTAERDAIGSRDLGLLSPAIGAGSGGHDLDLRRIRDQAERRAVVAAIACTNGNMARAAELLCVSRPTLYDLMRRLEIK